MTVDMKYGQHKGLCWVQILNSVTQFEVVFGLL